MSITSSIFILFVFITLILYFTVNNLSWRRGIIFAANLVFLFSFIGEPIRIIPYAAFILICYGLTLLVHKSANKKLPLLCSIIIIGLFIYLKQYSFARFMPALPFEYEIVGLSYLLFRVLHILFDTSMGSIKQPVGFVSYLTYIIFFPSFVSGPIQLYPEFEKQEREQREIKSREEMVSIFSRIVDGYVKIVFFSMVFSTIYVKFSQAAFGAGLAKLIAFQAVAIMAYTVFLYFNFSGCMDVVIGIGRLFGFTLPENFNRPFRSESFLKFWSNWHMTLSNWFKIYMFNPLLKIMMTRNSAKNLIPLYGVIAYFATFFVIGLWHESLWVGLMLGLGASLNKLYENTLRKRMGKKKFSSMEKNTVYRYAARGFTFAYLSMSLIFLWMDSDAVKHLCSVAGAPGVIAILAFATPVAAVIMFFADTFLGVYTAAREKFFKSKYSYPAMQLWLAVKIMFVTYFLIVAERITPDFVYQGF